MPCGAAQSQIQSAEESLEQLSMDTVAETMDEEGLMETMDEDEEGEPEDELSSAAIARQVRCPPPLAPTSAAQPGE